ncbi:MAG: hypothetical protein ASARMPREDX12_000265 [Alectoria sarmentosa]|nr:MAG: hypothetical protein ASARMPREDX12_000265 [Alectoria sarmentosa]
MLSNSSRLTKAQRARQSSPFSSPNSNLHASPIAVRRGSLEERRRPAANFNFPISPALADRADEEDQDQNDGEEEDQEEEIDEDEPGELSPLLPIFSAAQLDALPVYNLTHTLRLLIVPRCETTLSWDQLRSPQVSQFLIKPIQQQIRTSHFSKATLYALMANCLQFNKEVSMYPGNSGTSKTRALVCELLAIKLLKEFSTRELIGNQLSCLPASNGNAAPGPNWDSSHGGKAQPRAARISTLEIAIRAQSKRFLAHPLVVQQLEAIWAGTIVFHSAADNLHRPPEKVTPNQNRGYGAIGSRSAILQASPDRLQPAKQRDHLDPVTFSVRRSATLYDPRDASLFKLSRLRVPRYRQFLSTCSFAVLLGLYLAVLIERSLTITALEVVFWFWSAGFMLDEVVGFNEQGFSLYIMSFWNAFDLGILLLLVAYYCMRLYGLLMPDVRKHHTADNAYDLLAANAVLLFPRLFSVLDHYRYFSQLLIAFRMMAMDLMAVFVLIVISCSGFFVAFTLSFGTGDYDAASVAYALFQMLMGFTPAAWDSWGTYNILGKTILTLFLFICHFLIVTILITVLTNSFMAIVQNANEEHQFVFAVNTISMVKSDALFSYVAPTNVIAWLLAPLRFVLPFRQFVRINRTVIKVTHFPVLFLFYAYERVILRRSMFDTTELVEQRGRQGLEVRAFEAPDAGLNLFSPKLSRLREPSVATFHKDRALEEVFRRPFRDNTIRNIQKSHERRKTSNVVNNWMQNMGPNGTASPPVEQDLSVVDRLEARRVAHRLSQQLGRRRQPGLRRDFTEATMSIMSDPEDFVGAGRQERPPRRREDSDLPNMSMDDIPRQTDADGDDELVTNDDEDLITLDRPSATANRKVSINADLRQQDEDYFQQTPTAKPRIPYFSPDFSNNAKSSPPKVAAVRINVQRPTRAAHMRNVSTNTVLYDPPPPVNDSSTSSPTRKAITAKNSVRNAGTVTPAASAGRRTPKRQQPGASRPRPIMPPRSAFQSAPDLAGMLSFDQGRGRRHSFTMDLGSDIGDNKAIGGGYIGGVPNSFATQMAYATGAMRAGQAAVGGNEDQQRMGKLMLARMNALEEGFREVLKEVKDWRKDETRSTGDAPAIKFAETKVARTKGKRIANGKKEVKTKAKAEAQEKEANEQEPQEDDKGRGSSI